ncbi:MAG: hypothetical protein IKN09_03565 [Clostridia bacterium]|nr:hypothetical protein [Clostridia bacterium]MBR4261117.1 hypothetical protein [Clostridia bacterium]
MKNNTLIHATIIGLILLTLFTIVMMVMIGPNSIINQEKEKYDQTHTEERTEDKSNENVVVVEENK